MQWRYRNPHGLIIIILWVLLTTWLEYLCSNNSILDIIKILNSANYSYRVV